MVSLSSGVLRKPACAQSIPPTHMYSTVPRTGRERGGAWEHLLYQQHQISILHCVSLVSHSHKGWFVIFATSTAGNSKLVWFTCADLQHQFLVRPLWLLSALLRTWTESLVPQLSLPPITLQIRVERSITHICMTKILRLCLKLSTQTPDFPELSLVVPLAFACPTPACPWLHCDEALNYMVTQKASHESRISPIVPKMAGAYSVWTFNTFFFPLLTFTVILQNDFLSLCQQHNQLTYGSLHCSAHESPSQSMYFLTES